MAFFTTDGDLELIDTIDLLDTLSTLSDDDVINMNNMRHCLGARTIARLLDGDADVRFQTHDGTVTTADGKYTVYTSNKAGEFIEAMIDRQNNSANDAEYYGITVQTLRDALMPYLQENVYYLSLQN